MSMPFQTTHAEEQPENLPAVAKRVDKKVETAVDGEEEMTNKEQLGADWYCLERVRSLAQF